MQGLNALDGATQLVMVLWLLASSGVVRLVGFVLAPMAAASLVVLLGWLQQCASGWCVPTDRQAHGSSMGVVR
jgi:hypothetical protein